MDYNEENDLTKDIFRFLKDAEAIIVLASISLAISVLVISKDNTQLFVFNYSVTSAFMFISSSITYVIYELFKKYWSGSIRELKQKGEYSNFFFLYHLLQYAPVYFFIFGMVFLILIAYEFVSYYPDFSKQANVNVIPLFELVTLFFEIYFFGFLIYYFIIIIKNKYKKSGVFFNIIASGILIYFGMLVLNTLSQIISNNILINQNIINYAMYVLVFYGYISMLTSAIRLYHLGGKRRVVGIVVFIVSNSLIGFLLAYEVMNALKSANIIDRNFDLRNFIGNMTGDNISSSNKE